MGQKARKGINSKIQARRKSISKVSINDTQFWFKTGKITYLSNFYCQKDTRNLLEKERLVDGLFVDGKVWRNETVQAMQARKHRG